MEDPRAPISPSFRIFSRPGEGGRTDRPAWSNIRAHEGQARDSVSCLPHPHFSTKGGLLYRVVEKEGEVIEQLLVPRPYISKVLFMAHSNMLGAHLGMDKTRERVLASGPG